MYICSVRYRIILSYDGAAFFGWQIQPDQPSVQGALEEALGILLKDRISVTGAGRTDTGVNARGYVAHFDSGSALDCEQIRYKLNAMLPASISVEGLFPAEADFHARFDAKRREYRYYLHRRKDPFAVKSYLYEYPGLDFDAMNRAAGMLCGTHDFACFQKTGSDNKTSVCTVFEAEWTKLDETHWQFRISADRFLRNMVRAIVGTLLEVGRGKRDAASMQALLDSADRCSAGESVPGHALFLNSIEY